MRVKSLTISGFRNLKKTALEYRADASVFAFVGANGHGKTNLLEALFLLAISKSFRTRENEDLIAFDADHCSLKAVVEQGSEAITLELIVTREPSKKTLKVNGVQKKAADFMGHLNTVFFSPDDIGMIHLSPGIRRRYLDMLLSQLDREYLNDSLKYQQALKQRNSLLKQIADGQAGEEELSFWDEQLVTLGSGIMGKRVTVLEDINAKASGYYRQVSGEQDELIVQYSPSVKAEGFQDALLKNRSKDIAIGSTQKGPHRDDLIFLCNGHDMAAFASRGEWRSLVLTLKFAEIDLLKEKKGFYPILLLDDVFSELDDARQKILFNIIKNTQTFITTTHKEFLEVIEGEKQVYEVRDGKIEQF
ncbi:DNA replication/repair protein RecF [Candidatus Peregrinibacteria bacterium]|nr:DNA replication/repair protein RecF [Candidatus Peregrinibacteria bacterium]